MPRGKFKGHSVMFIIQNHTEYAEWMIDKMKGVSFAPIIKNDLRTWKLLLK